MAELKVWYTVGKPINTLEVPKGEVGRDGGAQARREAGATHWDRDGQGGQACRESGLGRRTPVRGQLSSVISSCDRDGRAWQAPTDGKEPG